MAKTADLEKPAVKAKIIAHIIEGLSDAEVAAAISDKRMSVTRQGITAFRHRHQADLAPVVAEVERQITDAAIADKVRRILDADEDYQRLGQVIAARAADQRYDEPGYATGLMVHQLKQIGSGRNAETVDEYKVDTAVIAERRALRREVAEALDHLPRGKDEGRDTSTFVLIRERIIEHGQRLEPLG